MCVCGERVTGYIQYRCLAPCGIATWCCGNLGIARIVGVGLADGKVHRLEVGSEGASPFVFLAVQVGFYWFRLRPFSFVITLREEDVGVLHARDAAVLVALGLVAGRGEEQLVAVVATKRGRILRTTRVEQLLLLNGIAAVFGLFLPLRSLSCRLQTHLYQALVGDAAFLGLFSLPYCLCLQRVLQLSFFHLVTSLYPFCQGMFAEQNPVEKGTFAGLHHLVPCLLDRLYRVASGLLDRFQRVAPGLSYCFQRVTPGLGFLSQRLFLGNLHGL